jgi:uncharacterized membrane protein YdjX (TVP38/TMEM64 family)
MKKLPFLISFSLLSSVVILYLVIPSFRDFVKQAFDVLTSDDETLIKQWVSKFKMAGPLTLILLMVIQMFLFVVPNVFVMMVAIVSYGPVWGAVISFLGVFASSSVGYLIGKYLGPLTVQKLMSDKVRNNTAQFIKRYGVTAIAITRISSFSNDSLSIVAGLLKMSYRKYILATLIGITPLIVLLAIYGKNGKILKSLIWIAAISLVILVIYIFLNEKKRKKRQITNGPSPEE